MQRLNRALDTQNFICIEKRGIPRFASFCFRFQTKMLKRTSFCSPIIPTLIFNETCWNYHQHDRLIDAQVATDFKLESQY